MPFKSIEQQLAESRKVRPTSLSSDAIKRTWSPKIREEALYGARITMRAYLDTLKKRLSEVVGGTLTPQQAEARLKESLRDLGYTPEKPMTIQDLSSSHRIQLIIDTNVKRARSMGQVAASEKPFILLAIPAWKLTRTGARKKPRGDWYRRWMQAGIKCGWKGASKLEMVALKTSPIWQALADGAGGYTDTLGSPFPPFAFGSGMAWVGVGRDKWREICKREGIDDGLDEIREKARELKAYPEPPSSPQKIDIDLPALTIAEEGAGNPLTRQVAPDTFISPQIGYSPAYEERDVANDVVDECIAIAKSAVSTVSEWRTQVDGMAEHQRDDKGKQKTLMMYAERISSYLRELDSIEGRIVGYGSSISTEPIPRSSAEQTSYDAAMKRYSIYAKSAARQAKRQESSARLWYMAAEKTVSS